MSYGSKGGKGSKGGGGSMSYGGKGKGETKSRCRSKGSKSSEAPSLAPSNTPDAKAEKTTAPTASPTIYCGKGDKPSGGSGKGGKSGGSMSYVGVPRVESPVNDPREASHRKPLLSCPAIFRSLVTHRKKVLLHFV